MISKIPRWAWVGAALLAGVGGMINAVGFLSFQHQGITHLTGATTLLGIALAGGRGDSAVRLAAMVGAFLLGCIASGALIRDSALQFGRRYGVALAIEALLLFCSVPLLQHFHPAGIYLASCACGLQNGMASTYSGAVFRTTHVSGAFTDLGIFIGQALGGLTVDRRRIRLGVVLIGSFLGGAVLGTAGFAHFSYAVLYFPATAIGIVGLAYTVYRQSHAV